MKLKLTLTPLIILSLFFLTTCSGEGIFYQIQTEVEVDDDALANIKFTDVIVTDRTSTDGYYIAKGVKIWYRSKSNSSWDTIDTPSKASAISSCVMYNGYLYYIIRTGDNSELYQLDINSDDTGAGTKIGTTLSPATSGNYLWAQLFTNEEQSRVFLNTVEYDEDGNPEVSALYYQDDGDGDISSSTLISTCVIDLEDFPVKGIGFGSGSDAWVIYNDDDDSSSSNNSGGELLDSNDSINFSTVDTSNAGDGWFTSIYATTSVGNSTDVVLIGAREDDDEYRIYYNGDAIVATTGTWNEVEEDDDIYFTSFCNISDMDGGTSYEDIILAGSREWDDSSYGGEGYYLIDISSPESIGDSDIDEDDDNFADEDYYSSSDLADSSILSITYDPYPSDGATYKVLMGVAYNYSDGGVWTLSSSDMEWEQE